MINQAYLFMRQFTEYFELNEAIFTECHKHAGLFPIVYHSRDAYQ